MSLSWVGDLSVPSVATEPIIEDWHLAPGTWHLAPVAGCRVPVAVVGRRLAGAAGLVRRGAEGLEQWDRGDLALGEFLPTDARGVPPTFTRDGALRSDDQVEGYVVVG